MKRAGIGSALLITAEKYAAQKGIIDIHTKCADDYIEALHFYPSRGFIESERSGGLIHFVKRISSL